MMPIIKVNQPNGFSFSSQPRHPRGGRTVVIVDSIGDGQAVWLLLLLQNSSGGIVDLFKKNQSQQICRRCENGSSEAQGGVCTSLGADPDESLSEPLMVSGG